jgi:polyferredoxin
MPLGKTRDRVVYGLARAARRAAQQRGSMPGMIHRYTLRRWLVAGFFTLGIAALPVFGILRFDLWGGRHVYLGREHDLVEVARRFAFPFLAINLVILVASRYLGRYLCGFVCPYGAVARLAEWLRFRARTRRGRGLGAIALLLVCASLASIAFAFWVDWRVFAAGSSLAISLASAFLLGLIASLFLMVQRLGLGFCRDWCPSGVYFAVLGHETTNAIEFAHPDACTDCKACEKSCPMDLLPREMRGAEARPGGGIYPDGLTDFALCIRCGDCVAACEGTTARSAAPTPLRMGFLSDRARSELRTGEDQA